MLPSPCRALLTKEVGPLQSFCGFFTCWWLALMPYGEQSLLCPKNNEGPDDQLHLVYASTGWTGDYKQAKHKGGSDLAPTFVGAIL